MKIRLSLVFLIITAAAGAQAEAPLFAADETIALSIKAPVRALIRAKHDKEKYDAIVSYTDNTGREVTLDAQISSRGNARLDSCYFPPIRLEFDPATTSGTVFDGQKRLKIVTHCQRGRDGEAWVLQEYGIYRAYNEITDYSYRVRKLDMSWQDTESEGWRRDAPAFFIEATGAAARRLQRNSIRPPEVQTAQFDLVETTHQMLFQYLIGNSDFSITRGPEGEGCCHNARVIARTGEQDQWVILPYDFDQAGIINTDYALPDRRLRIRRVTQRVYRGFCWQNDSLLDSVALFNERREAITTALVPAEISNSRQRRIRRFVDRFYDTINDPEELQEDLLAKCRGGVTFAIRKTRTAGQ